MSTTTLEQLKTWGFEGSLSLGAAILFSQGVISPLTIGMAGVFFTLQAKANFPAYSWISSIKEDLDDEYQPEDTDSEDEALEQAFEAEVGTTPINDGIRAQLFENSVESYVAPTGFRRIPGMTWLLGEQRVKYTLDKIDTGEVAGMEYGVTRSGNSFRY